MRNQENVYFAWATPKIMIPIYILLILTSFLIIPLILLIFLYLGYSRVIKITKDGEVSIPTNLFNTKMPKNVYTCNQDTGASNGWPGGSSGFGFYFDLKNISKVYLVQNEKEKQVLKEKTPLIGRVRGPTTVFVSNLNKTVCIVFKKPLAYFNGFEVNNPNEGLDKIYISLKKPNDFIKKVSR